MVFKQAFMSYKYLLNFKNYKNSEILLKSLFLIIVLPVFTVLFVLTWLLYFVERIFSIFYKWFLMFHMRMIQARSRATVWMIRLNSLVTLVVTLILLPFVVTYYAAMLLKILLKHIMRTLIVKLDFSIQFTISEIRIFDDAMINKASMEFMFKDAAKTEALGKMLESYLNSSPEFFDEEETDTVIIEDKGKKR